jgi:hypothetical protein
VGGVREGQPGGHGGDLQDAALVTAMASLTGVIGDGDLPPGQGGELVVQARLVALDGEQVMRAAAGQVGGVATLGVHRVGRDDGSGDAGAVQQEREHRDFIGLRADFRLAQDGAVSMVERGQQVIAGVPAAGGAA